MNRNLPHNDRNFENFIDNIVTDFSGCSIDQVDSLITTSEVIKAALSLKKGKAPGIDSIRNEMMKEGISVLAPSLTCIFNEILKQGVFPDAWRLSTLTVIHKKVAKNVPKHYRGIAVSSDLFKMLCLVLYNRLSVFTNSNYVIPSNQIGFRKYSRTSDHV